MKRATFVVAVIVLLVAGLSGAQEGAETGCLKVALSSVESPTPVNPAGLESEDRVAGEYSAQRTTDLIFNVLFPASMTGEGVLTLRVTTPRGHLYRQLDVPVLLDPGAGGAGTRRIAGYPYPVRVETPSSLEMGRESFNAIQVAMPVGGTSVVSSSLYGLWQVEGEFTGELSACVAATAFTITE